MFALLFVAHNIADSLHWPDRASTAVASLARSSSTSSYCHRACRGRNFLFDGLAWSMLRIKRIHLCP